MLCEDDIDSGAYHCNISVWLAISSIRSKRGVDGCVGDPTLASDTTCAETVLEEWLNRQLYQWSAGICNMQAYLLPLDRSTRMTFLRGNADRNFGKHDRQYGVRTKYTRLRDDGSDKSLHFRVTDAAELRGETQSSGSIRVGPSDPTTMSGERSLDERLLGTDKTFNFLSGVACTCAIDVASQNSVWTFAHLRKLCAPS